MSLPSALAAYGRLFNNILDGERRPALFHCTTGKDRTGWAAAATLTLLEVSEEDVLADYMITNRDLLPAVKPLSNDREILHGQADSPGSRFARRVRPTPRARPASLSSWSAKTYA